MSVGVSTLLSSSLTPASCVDQDVVGLLRARYGGVIAQDIADRLQESALHHFSYAHVRAFETHILPQARARVRLAVRTYRAWRFMDQKRASSLDQPSSSQLSGQGILQRYHAYDQEFARDTLAHAWRIYKMAQKDYHAVRHLYLKKHFRFQSPPTQTPPHDKRDRSHV